MCFFIVNLNYIQRQSYRLQVNLSRRYLLIVFFFIMDTRWPIFDTPLLLSLHLGLSMMGSLAGISYNFPLFLIGWIYLGKSTSGAHQIMSLDRLRIVRMVSDSIK
jgi:hypothetical protein